MKPSRQHVGFSSVLVTLLFAASLYGQVPAPEPVPFISQPLVPTSVAPGSGAFTLIVNGTGFTTNSIVHWNGNPRPTIFNSNFPNQLQAIIPDTDVATATTAEVAVDNPAPGGSGSVRSNVVYFPVATSITSISLGRTDTGAHNTPQYVTEGDIDGDGDLDLAVANWGSNTVSFSRNNGGANFQLLGTFVTETQPATLVLRDFNRDGFLDLATTVSTGNVSIRLGNGDGTFGASTTFATAEGPGQIATADFDGDGFLDLAVGCSGALNPPAVSILLGNGDGTFQPRVDNVTTVTGSVAVGDFDGDGALDLAAANFFANTVSIFLGNGDGTFQAPTTFSTASGPYALIAADFDGDSVLDLAVTNFSASTISIFLGNGNGTFQAGVNFVTSLSPNFLTTQDFDGDGTLDLATSTTNGAQTAGNVEILRGNGDGTFQFRLLFPAASGAFGVASGDFNGDGRIDVAVANSLSSSIAVFLEQPPPAPAVQLSTTNLNFGVQLVGTTSTAQQVTLTNNGTATLAFTSV
ncbi:MAG: VCBS repeat-containing protein, partial [Acidobacteria bacterium]|nr:VCBS repeat-containing protein [Acidobacteriota bacterium]